jgi:DNA polymerase-3 subunit beta
VAELSRLLSEEKEINLALSRKSLALKAGDNFLFVRLLEKKFPDYRRIVPESFKFRFLLSRLELLNILKRISLLSTERFKGVVFHFHPDTLEATFTNPEVGEGREVIPHNLESGQEEQLPLQVGFNARYLLEPLNIMASEQVALEVNDSDHPCRLSEPKDPDYSAIIMPWSL